MYGVMSVSSVGCVSKPLKEDTDMTLPTDPKGYGKETIRGRDTSPRP